MIAVEMHAPELMVLSGDGVAVGDEAGDGPVGIGQGISPVGPAGQLLPALVIGKNVFHRYASGGVVVAGLFLCCVDLGRADLVHFPRWCDRLVGVITPQSQVALVEQDVDFGKWRNSSAIPSPRMAVVSCMRPGRGLPAHSV